MEYELDDEQLEAMRGREDPEVAAVLPAPRHFSDDEVAQLRNELAEARQQNRRDMKLFKYVCHKCGLAFEDTRDEAITHADMRGDCPRCGAGNEPA